jgi:hypothetical protein
VFRTEAEIVALSCEPHYQRNPFAFAAKQAEVTARNGLGAPVSDETLKQFLGELADILGFSVTPGSLSDPLLQRDLVVLAPAVRGRLLFARTSAAAVQPDLIARLP